MARAFSVIKYLSNVQNIPEKDLAAVGHGEYRPLVPNTSPENQAKNRRVEMHIKWQN
jgi:chemotaxis protein MotB